MTMKQMMAQVQKEKKEAEKKLQGPAKEQEMMHVKDGENPHWKVVSRAELDLQ